MEADRKTRELKMTEIENINNLIDTFPFKKSEILEERLFLESKKLSRTKNWIIKLSCWHCPVNCVSSLLV